mmetsp:Transcript_32919/g.71822  ORF Transcript_32919/g.71822 Transcript_32919/m.71822 type:complete len:214 (-) Transcript_32919:46-687(-)
MGFSPWTASRDLTPLLRAGSCYHHCAALGSALQLLCSAALSTCWEGRGAEGCLTRSNVLTWTWDSETPCHHCTLGDTVQQLLPPMAVCMSPAVAMAPGRRGCGAWSASTQRLVLGASSLPCRCLGGALPPSLPAAASACSAAGTAAGHWHRSNASTPPQALGSLCPPCRRHGSLAGPPLAGDEDAAPTICPSSQLICWSDQMLRPSRSPMPSH